MKSVSKKKIVKGSNDSRGQKTHEHKRDEDECFLRIPDKDVQKDKKGRTEQMRGTRGIKSAGRAASGEKQGGK